MPTFFNGKFLSIIGAPLVLTLALAVAPSLQAATVIFDDNASFDTNFYKPSGAIGDQRLAQTGSSLHFAPVAGETNATAIYNTNTTGGSGGNGGTALVAPLNKYSIGAAGIILEADFKNDSFNTSNGLGFYFGLNDSATDGGLVLFRPSATGSDGDADVRFYTGANPTAASNVGTRFGPSSNPFGVILTDLSKFYTFQLTLTLDGSDVDFAAKLFDGATQLGNTVQTSIAASNFTLNGQVGMRIGGGVNTMEDVSRFSVVPEPGSVALLGLAAIFGVGGRLLSRTHARRRRIA